VVSKFQNELSTHLLYNSHYTLPEFHNYTSCQTQTTLPRSTHHFTIILTSNNMPEITIVTHLKDETSVYGRLRRSIWLSYKKHDSDPECGQYDVEDLFTACAAAWPEIFRTTSNIYRLCYIEDGYPIEIVPGVEQDFLHFLDAIRRCQRCQSSRVEICLWQKNRAGEEGTWVERRPYIVNRSKEGVFKPE